MIEVKPTYAAIEAVRDICEPWIEIWSGDEWGESLSNLHAAATTCYGFDDGDCAKLAEIMLDNIISQHEWMESEGRGLGLSTPQQEELAITAAREAREYWRKGGNLGESAEHAVNAARAMVDKLPLWLFGNTIT